MIKYAHLRIICISLPFDTSHRPQTSKCDHFSRLWVIKGRASQPTFGYFLRICVRKCQTEQLKSAGEIARMSACLWQGLSVDRDMTFSTEDVTPLEST